MAKDLGGKGNIVVITGLSTAEQFQASVAE
jgi:hypothetical protein